MLCVLRYCSPTHHSYITHLWLIFPLLFLGGDSLVMRHWSQGHIYSQHTFQENILSLITSYNKVYGTLSYPQSKYLCNNKMSRLCTYIRRIFLNSTHHDSDRKSSSMPRRDSVVQRFSEKSYMFSLKKKKKVKLNFNLRSSRSSVRIIFSEKRRGFCVLSVFWFKFMEKMKIWQITGKKYNSEKLCKAWHTIWSSSDSFVKHMLWILKVALRDVTLP